MKTGTLVQHARKLEKFDCPAITCTLGFLMQSWRSERISLDPSICHGKPVVRGTRVLVANVVGAVAAGQSHKKIFEDYPSLQEVAIRACLAFAGNLTARETMEV